MIDPKDIDRLAKVVLKYQTAETEKEKDEIFDKEYCEIDAIRFKSPEKLWAIILRVHALTNDPEVLAVLSAGLLEDLLAQFPYQSIDWVEEQARKDPRFKKLLRGVWQNLMPDEIWERLQKLRE